MREPIFVTEIKEPLPDVYSGEEYFSADFDFSDMEFRVHWHLELEFKEWGVKNLEAVITKVVGRINCRFADRFIQTAWKLGIIKDIEDAEDEEGYKVGIIYIVADEKNEDWKIINNIVPSSCMSPTVAEIDLTKKEITISNTA